MRECNLNCRWGESEVMTRVFFLGTYLPRFQPSAKVTVASDVRTEQIVSALVGAGHEVRLCSATHYGRTRGRRYLRLRNAQAPQYYEMNYFLSDQLDDLKRLVDDFSPDCVVGVSQWPSRIATSLGLGLPLWCDLWGGAMSEAQAKAYVYKDNSFINHFWGMERPVLERGDVFSTCSTFQEHFLIGELAVMGRLNRASFGYKFAHTIPPGISEEHLETPRGRVLRGKVVEPDDFVILWAGGYNTWTDIETLFAGLEEVFRAHRKARFVSFGGCIQGHDDVTYARFCRLVEGSKFRKNYVLLGWRSRRDVLRAYKESDIGINIDRYHYELVFGTRTRLVSMIAYGLPVITTTGCELSYIIKENGLGLTFEIGDARGLANALLNYAKDLKANRRHYSTVALQHFKEHYTYTRTCEPLLKWLKKPRRAPDSDCSKRPVLVVDSASRQVSQAPDHGLFTVATEKLAKNDDKAARSLLQALITICPEHIMAHYHLGSLLIREGDFKGALDLFRKAKAIAKKGEGRGEAALLGGISFHLGECRFRMGQKGLAAREFRRCLELIPGHRKARKWLEKLGA
ncbi:hypothetical protein DRQ29_06345 [bacterium]|nr:MAG: hypothetical protein DRQ29_06345 [bacterium]